MNSISTLWSAFLSAAFSGPVRQEMELNVESMMREGFSKEEAISELILAHHVPSTGSTASTVTRLGAPASALPAFQALHTALTAYYAG